MRVLIYSWTPTTSVSASLSAPIGVNFARHGGVSGNSSFSCPPDNKFRSIFMHCRALAFPQPNAFFLFVQNFSTYLMKHLAMKIRAWMTLEFWSTTPVATCNFLVLVIQYGETGRRPCPTTFPEPSITSIVVFAELLNGLRPECFFCRCLPAYNT